MPSAVMKVENSFPVSDGQQHHVIEDVQGEEEIAQPEKVEPLNQFEDNIASSRPFFWLYSYGML